VKPAFIEFVRPTQKYADIIVPRARAKHEEENSIAIDFIVHNLEHKLTQRGFKIEH
jgi:uridine kinase